MPVRAIAAALAGRRIESTGMTLVERAQAGDARAFDELYRIFAPSVHALLLSRLPPHEVDDILQDVFFHAHRALKDLRDPESFGPWLQAMARNAAIDRIRSLRRRPSVDALPDLAARDRSDGELREIVLRHIQSLPETYRESIAMRLIEGMTGPEIAGKTGMSPGSVRVHLHRGMELLRDLLRKDGWP